MRKAIGFCWVITIVFWGNIWAQQREKQVSGLVYTADGKEAVGISVLIKGTKGMTRTDAAGRYSFKLEEGDYELLFKSMGSVDQVIRIQVRDTRPTVIAPVTLQATSYDLKEVVITGQYEAQSLRNSVYRVRTISQQQILARASTSIENILNTELGIRFSNDMALGESGIELMGMGGRNVKVMVDGLPIVDRGDLTQSLSQIDVNTIERIEIVEGPMAVNYGTDALAGVINIITKKMEGDALLLGVRVQEETMGKEYDFLQKNGLHNANVNALWGKKGWTAGLSGSRNNAGGVEGGGPGAIDHWMPKDQWFGSAGLGYGTTTWEVKYRVDYLNEDILNLGTLNTNTYRISRVNYLTDRWTHQLQGRWTASPVLSFNLNGSYQDYARRTRSVIRDYRNGTTELSTNAGSQDTSTFLTSLVRLTAQYAVSDRVMLQPGVEYRSDKSTGQRIEGKPQIDDYAFFISGEWKWKELVVRPGLRFIHNSVYDAPPIIPSLNAKWHLSDQWDLRASYGRGFRAPALRELYFHFFDANHAIAGNPNLKAEHSNSYQASLTWNGVERGPVKWSSAWNAFYNDFKDQINLGIDPEYVTQYSYINIDRFRTAGGTWENNISYKNLEAKIGFSYIGRYNQLSGELNNIPDMQWTPEVNSVINYTIPKWKAGVNFFYKFNGKRTGFNAITNEEDGTVTGRRFQIQSYHTADLTLNKQLIKGLILNGGIRNLFDVTTLDNTSLGSGGPHATDTGPIPISYGRSYFLGLKYDIHIHQ